MAIIALLSRFHGVLCDATALLPRFHGVVTECCVMNAPRNRIGNAARVPWERNERGGKRREIAGNLHQELRKIATKRSGSSITNAFIVTRTPRERNENAVLVHYSIFKKIKDFLWRSHGVLNKFGTPYVYIV